MAHQRRQKQAARRVRAGRLKIWTRYAASRAAYQGGAERTREIAFAAAHYTAMRSAPASATPEFWAAWDAAGGAS